MFLDFKKLQRKRKILIVFSLAIFVSFLFPRLAFAQVEDFFSLHCGAFDPICWALEALASVLIKFFVLLTFGIPLILSALFAGIMVLILGWIISPAFISLKFTNNAFVNAGLSITRGFSNLGFIVFLVAIGLATALRIEEYKAKKTLPILIIIALLINFSPVFCGIIIDASNIVMNFFLEKITGIEGFINIINQTGSSLMNLLFGSQFKIGAVIAAAVVVLVLIVFNFFAGFIFILFSALFIMRYIMLWILVILSPIAFVSYILPATRRGGSLLSWRKWWEQLVAWSIIGIIASFFLYLGFFMIALINNNPRYFTCLPGDTNPDGTPKCGSELGLMNNVVPYLIPLVLLWIAHRETKRTSAMFASEIIEMPGKVAKAAGQVALIAATAGAAAGTAAGVLGKAAAGAQKLETTLGKVPIVGKPLKYAVGKPISWATRGAEMVYKPYLEEYAAKMRKINIDKQMKDLGIEEDIQGQVDYVNRQIIDSRKVQALAWMAGKGTLQKAPQVWDEAARLVEKFADNPHFRKEAGDIADVIPKKISAEAKAKLEPTKEDREEMQKKIDETAKKLSAEVELKPVISEEATRLLREKVVKTAEEAQELAAKNVAARYIHITELKPGQIKDVAKKSVESLIFARALRDTTSGHIQMIINNFKPETSNKVIEQTFNRMFTGKTDKENRKILEDYYLSDPRHARMVHWSFQTPAGREMDLIWRRYMPKTKTERPDFGAFEAEMERKKAEIERKKMEEKKIEEEEKPKEEEFGKPKKIWKRKGPTPPYE